MTATGLIYSQPLRTLFVCHESITMAGVERRIGRAIAEDISLLDACIMVHPQPVAHSLKELASGDTLR